MQAALTVRVAAARATRTRMRDRAPSLSGSDSSDANWEIALELEDDTRDDLFLDAPGGESSGQGDRKVTMPPRVIPVNHGESRRLDDREDDLKAEMRTVTVSVLSEHNRLVGKGGLHRQSAQELAEADALDDELSRAGLALADALSEPGHHCSEDEVGLFINTALYLR
jgi:hypothetical protein